MSGCFPFNSLSDARYCPIQTTADEAPYRVVNHVVHVGTAPPEEQLEELDEDRQRKPENRDLPPPHLPERRTKGEPQRDEHQHIHDGVGRKDLLGIMPQGDGLKVREGFRSPEHQGRAKQPRHIDQQKQPGDGRGSFLPALYRNQRHAARHHYAERSHVNPQRHAVVKIGDIVTEKDPVGHG